MEDNPLAALPVFPFIVASQTVPPRFWNRESERARKHIFLRPNLPAGVATGARGEIIVAESIPRGNNERRCRRREGIVSAV